MSGRPKADGVRGWANEAGAVAARVGSRFARRAPRGRAAGDIRGLQGDAERKGGWRLAGRAADAVRADRARDVAEHPGPPGGVPVADGTGLLEAFATSCGAARRYADTAGRIESTRVGVFPGNAAPRGHVPVDRPPDRPRERADDRPPDRAVGAPDAAGFPAQLGPARRTVDRAAGPGGGAARGATGDAVDGSGAARREFPGGGPTGRRAPVGGSGRCRPGRPTRRPPAGTGRVAGRVEGAAGARPAALPTPAGAPAGG